MRNKAGNSALLILVGLFIISLFFMFVLFGSNIGKNFQMLSQKKTEQQTEAKGRPTETLASLTITPDPVPVGIDPTVNGAGFNQNTNLLVGIPGDLRFQSVTTDSTGAFSFVYTGRELIQVTYTMEAWGRRGKMWELKASTLLI